MVITVRMVVAAAAFVALVFSIFSAVIWRRRRTYPGNGRQAIATMLAILCVLLATLQPVLPDWIGVVSADAMGAAAAILFLEAAQEYRGVRPQVLAIRATGILVVLAVVYFVYFSRNINARVVTISAFIGLVMLFCSVTLLRASGSRRTLAVVVSGVMFAMCAALLMTRAIYFVFAPTLTDLSKASWVEGLQGFRVSTYQLLPHNAATLALHVAALGIGVSCCWFQVCSGPLSQCHPLPARGATHAFCGAAPGTLWGVPGRVGSQGVFQVH